MRYQIKHGIVRAAWKGPHCVQRQLTRRAVPLGRATPRLVSFARRETRTHVFRSRFVRPQVPNASYYLPISFAHSTSRFVRTEWRHFRILGMCPGARPFDLGPSSFHSTPPPPLPKASLQRKTLLPFDTRKILRPSLTHNRYLLRYESVLRIRDHLVLSSVPHSIFVLAK